MASKQEEIEKKKIAPFFEKRGEEIVSQQLAILLCFRIVRLI